MRVLGILAPLLSFPLSASLLWAAPVSSLKEYLGKALPAQETAALDTRSSPILFKEVELRVGADDEDFKSARFRISPYGFAERSHQKELTQIESDLYNAQIKENSSLRSYEIGKLVIALHVQQERLALLKKVKVLYDRIVSAFELNFSLLAQKPEDYIKLLEKRLIAQESIVENENLVKQSQVSLAKAAGLPVEEFAVNLDQLVNLEDIEAKVKSWPVEHSSPSLANKSLQLRKAQLETVIVDDSRGLLLNYVDVGTSLKKDGSPDKLEFGLGVSLPLFSGEYKAKAFEAEAKKMQAKNDLESTQLQESLTAEDLRNRILYRVDHSKALASKDLEALLTRVQKRSREQLGAGSLPALNVELAFEELRLRQLDAKEPVWEEFLDLAQLTGQLDSGANLLLSDSSGRSNRGG